MAHQNEMSLGVLANKLEQYRFEIQQIERQIHAIRDKKENLLLCRESLLELMRKKKGDIILVPLKGEIFFQTEFSDVKTVVLGIGAEIAAEYSFEEAEKKIQIQIEKLDMNANEISQYYGQLISQYNEQQQTLQQLLKKQKK